MGKRRLARPRRAAYDDEGGHRLVRHPDQIMARPGTPFLSATPTQG
jgi:hypothetical protein